MAEPVHSCPGRCGAQVVYHRFACPPCWSRLPAELRRPIQQHYRGDQNAHAAALRTAITWFADHPDPASSSAAGAAGE